MSIAVMADSTVGKWNIEQGDHGLCSFQKVIQGKYPPSITDIWMIVHALEKSKLKHNGRAKLRQP
jgi:hypothetical protein